jgi:hypothetical protein
MEEGMMGQSNGQFVYHGIWVLFAGREQWKRNLEPACLGTRNRKSG